MFFADNNEQCMCLEKKKESVVLHKLLIDSTTYVVQDFQFRNINLRLDNF